MLLLAMYECQIHHIIIGNVAAFIHTDMVLLQNPFPTHPRTSTHSWVGVFGLGPKYLVDEYAVLDTRYWVLQETLVMWVTYHEFFVMLPLEYIWYMALQKKHWSRHFWAIITGRD